jgi:uncharacterized protein (DUF4415 family)
MKEENMRKGYKALPKHLQSELDALAKMKDEDIDLSDIPERRDFSGGVRGRFYKPVKKQVTLRLDADVLDWFKRQADNDGGYQTRINAALRGIVEKAMHKTG